MLHDLDGRIDAVLDAGPTVHGVESTVLDPCQSPMVLYRPGAVTSGQIREVAGPVELFKGNGELLETPRESMPSPGVGLRHYAPKAQLVLVDAPLAELGMRLAEAAQDERLERLGIMLPAEVTLPAGLFLSLWYLRGAISGAAPKELARELYAGLRALDAKGCTMILCPLPPAQGIGAAIRDRLRKAAAKGKTGNGE